MTEMAPTIRDWEDPHCYAALLGADRSAFAWEWLRRSTPYRAAWELYRSQAISDVDLSARFGLERWEDPEIAIPHARPLWSGRLFPHVLTSGVSRFVAPAHERINLHRLARHVTIEIAVDGTEHLLLSDGCHFLRLDIIAGTLIGCPASLIYLVDGLGKIRGSANELHRLSGLVRDGRFVDEIPMNAARHRRWIQELRTADALLAGCTQQQMAHSFFRPFVTQSRWRSEFPSYRSRVQRLVATARQRLTYPLDHWFVPNVRRSPEKSHLPTAAAASRL